MKEFLKAMNKLAENCVVKLLKVNSIGECKVVHLDKGEYKSYSPYLNVWVDECSSKELIHPDYAEAFKSIINIDNINKQLKYHKYIHFKFLRRKNEYTDEYRMSVITILPTEENYFYLIVYDINEC